MKMSRHQARRRRKVQKWILRFGYVSIFWSAAFGSRIIAVVLAVVLFAYSLIGVEYYD